MLFVFHFPFILPTQARSSPGRHLPAARHDTERAAIEAPVTLEQASWNGYMSALLLGLAVRLTYSS